MPNVVGPDCVDTPSTDGLCTFPAKALGGSSSTSPNVYFEGEKVEHYPVAQNILLDEVEGTPLPTNVLGVCQPGIRRLQPVINQNVLINGNLFAVTGDEAELVTGVTTPRPLTGPFKYPTIVIG
mgnify:FL=1